MPQEEGDIQRMVFLLEARTKELEGGMKKAQAIANKAYHGMKRDSRTATQQMEADMNRTTATINRAVAATSTKIGSLGKSMIAGFAGGLAAGGIAGIMSRLGQLASGVAAIGDEARRAGLGIKAFQELKYVAEQNRVGVDALTDGMKELSLRADEFIVTGAGSAAESFKRLGFSAEELNKKLQDPSALFTEIIGKLQKLDRAAQIRIADELFGGTGGEQFVQLIAQGEDGISRTIDEANRLGIVLSSDVIAKAAEVDRQFNRIANTIGSGIRAALVDATHAVTAFLNALKAPPEGALARNAEEAAKLSATLQEMTSRVGAFLPGDAEDQLRTMIALFIGNEKSATETKDALLELIRLNPDFAAWGAGLTTLINDLDNATAAAREAKAAMNADTLRNMGAEDFSFGDVQRLRVTKPTTVPGSGATAKRDKAADEAERQAKAVRDLIAGLEFERSLIGLSALDQQKMNALRQAGAAATGEQRLAIERLVEDTYNEQLRVDQLKSTFDMLGDAGKTALDGIADALADGKIEAEEFGDILRNVLGMIGQNLMNQGMGLLGNLFQPRAAAPLRLGYQLPGYATGTNDHPGGLAKIFEKGSEIVDLPKHTRVIPHDVSMAAARAGGTSSSQSIEVPIQISIDARGSDEAGMQRVSQQLANIQSELPGRVKQIVRTYGNKWR